MTREHLFIGIFLAGIVIWTATLAIMHAAEALYLPAITALLGFFIGRYRS